VKKYKERKLVIKGSEYAKPNGKIFLTPAVQMDLPFFYLSEHASVVMNEYHDAAD